MFMDSKLGDDVGQQEMSVVLSCRVHTVLNLESHL